MFLSPEEVEHEGTLESFKEFDRVKPVYFIQKEIEGVKVKAIIDGYKYNCYAKQAGIEKIYACELSGFESDDELKLLMAQLQRNNHDSLIALFNMIQVLWPIYFKGPGYRSDLEEKELDEPTESKDGGKPLNIYERIGRQLNLSGNKVKHIRKVGLVNSLHFNRIETSRFTLYAAYLECVKEEKGEMPAAPAVKAPTFISTDTGVPAFSSPTTTADVISDNTAEEITTPVATDSPVVGEGIIETLSSDESEFITVRGICQCCNNETEIKINKNQIR